MSIRFTKMHGAGNDFMVIDAIHQVFDLTSERIRTLADRHFGVGFDQLLLVEKPLSSEAEFRYRIYNADGSEVAQCGNGARCFARFVTDKGLTTNTSIVVETSAGLLTLDLGQAGVVTVDMGQPRFIAEEIPFSGVLDAVSRSQVDIGGETQDIVTLSMGNPHAVLFVDDVDTAPVNELGPLIEHHHVFPERVNVGFMQIIDRQHIRLRVFERGTGETLACGSGACAAVVSGIRTGMLDQRVDVALRGGNISVNWSGEGSPVYLTGPTENVFEGQIEL